MRVGDFVIVEGDAEKYVGVIYLKDEDTMCLRPVIIDHYVRIGTVPQRVIASVCSRWFYSKKITRLATSDEITMLVESISGTDLIVAQEWLVKKMQVYG